MEDKTMIGMEFVQIPAGEFDMGSPASDNYSYDSERPSIT
jgi:formylglycine-generating enzyme required for sulfatase activity